MSLRCHKCHRELPSGAVQFYERRFYCDSCMKAVSASRTPVPQDVGTEGSLRRWKTGRILKATITVIVVALIVAAVLHKNRMLRQETEDSARAARRADSLKVAQEMAVRARADSLIRAASARTAKSLGEEDLSLALGVALADSTQSRAAGILQEEKDRREKARAEEERRAAAAAEAQGLRDRIQSILSITKGEQTIDGTSCKKATYARVENIVRRHPTWSDDEIALVACGFIRTGMTAEQLIESWGRPEDINRTVTSLGVSEQWVYNSPYGPYVYLDGGVVTSWQD